MAANSNDFGFTYVLPNSDSLSLYLDELRKIDRSYRTILPKSTQNQRSYLVLFDPELYYNRPTQAIEITVSRTVQPNVYYPHMELASGQNQTHLPSGHSSNDSTKQNPFYSSLLGTQPIYTSAGESSSSSHDTQGNALNHPAFPYQIPPSILELVLAAPSVTRESSHELLSTPYSPYRHAILSPQLHSQAQLSASTTFSQELSGLEYRWLYQHHLLDSERRYRLAHDQQVIPGHTGQHRGRDYWGHHHPPPYASGGPPPIHPISFRFRGVSSIPPIANIVTPKSLLHSLFPRLLREHLRWLRHYDKPTDAVETALAAFETGQFHISGRAWETDEVVVVPIRQRFQPTNRVQFTNTNDPSRFSHHHHQRQSRGGWNQPYSSAVEHPQQHGITLPGTCLLGSSRADRMMYSKELSSSSGYLTMPYAQPDLHRLSLVMASPQPPQGGPLGIADALSHIPSQTKVPLVDCIGSHSSPTGYIAQELRPAAIHVAHITRFPLQPAPYPINVVPTSTVSASSSSKSSSTQASNSKPGTETTPPLNLTAIKTGIGLANPYLTDYGYFVRKPIDAGKLDVIVDVHSYGRLKLPPNSKPENDPPSPIAAITLDKNVISHPFNVIDPQRDPRVTQYRPLIREQQRFVHDATHVLNAPRPQPSNSNTAPHTSLIPSFPQPPNQGAISTPMSNDEIRLGIELYVHQTRATINNAQLQSNRHYYLDKQFPVSKREQFLNSLLHIDLLSHYGAIGYHSIYRDASLLYDEYQRGTPSQSMIIRHPFFVNLLALHRSNLITPSSIQTFALDQRFVLRFLHHIILLTLSPHLYARVLDLPSDSDLLEMKKYLQPLPLASSFTSTFSPLGKLLIGLPEMVHTASASLYSSHPHDFTSFNNRVGYIFHDIRFFNPEITQNEPKPSSSSSSSSRPPSKTSSSSSSSTNILPHRIFRTQCSSYVPAASAKLNVRPKKFPSLLELLYPYPHETNILTPIRSFLDPQHRFPFYSLNYLTSYQHIQHTQDIIISILANNGQLPTRGLNPPPLTVARSEQSVVSAFHQTIVPKPCLYFFNQESLAQIIEYLHQIFYSRCRIIPSTQIPRQPRVLHPHQQQTPFLMASNTEPYPHASTDGVTPALTSSNPPQDGHDRQYKSPAMTTTTEDESMQVLALDGSTSAGKQRGSTVRPFYRQYPVGHTDIPEDSDIEVKRDAVKLISPSHLSLQFVMQLLVGSYLQANTSLAHLLYDSVFGTSYLDFRDAIQDHFSHRIDQIVRRLHASNRDGAEDTSASAERDNQSSDTVKKSAKLSSKLSAPAKNQMKSLLAAYYSQSLNTENRSRGRKSPGQKAHKSRKSREKTRKEDTEGALSPESSGDYDSDDEDLSQTGDDDDDAGLEKDMASTSIGVFVSMHSHLEKFREDDAAAVSEDTHDEMDEHVHSEEHDQSNSSYSASPSDASDSAESDEGSSDDEYHPYRQPRKRVTCQPRKRRSRRHVDLEDEEYTDTTPTSIVQDTQTRTQTSSFQHQGAADLAPHSTSEPVIKPKRFNAAALLAEQLGEYISPPFTSPFSPSSSCTGQFTSLDSNSSIYPAGVNIQQASVHNYTSHAARMSKRGRYPTGTTTQQEWVQLPPSDMPHEPPSVPDIRDPSTQSHSMQSLDPEHPHQQTPPVLKENPYAINAFQFLEYQHNPDFNPESIPPNDLQSVYDDEIFHTCIFLSTLSGDAIEQFSLTYLLEMANHSPLHNHNYRKLCHYPIIPPGLATLSQPFLQHLFHEEYQRDTSDVSDSEEGSSAEEELDKNIDPTKFSLRECVEKRLYFHQYTPPKRIVRFMAEYERRHENTKKPPALRKQAKRELELLPPLNRPEIYIDYESDYNSHYAFYTHLSPHERKAVNLMKMVTRGNEFYNTVRNNQTADIKYISTLYNSAAVVNNNPVIASLVIHPDNQGDDMDGYDEDSDGEFSEGRRRITRSAAAIAEMNEEVLSSPTALAAYPSTNTEYNEHHQQYASHDAMGEHHMGLAGPVPGFQLSTTHSPSSNSPHNNEHGIIQTTNEITMRIDNDRITSQCVDSNSNPLPYTGETLSSTQPLSPHESDALELELEDDDQDKKTELVNFISATIDYMQPTRDGIMNQHHRFKFAHDHLRLLGTLSDVVINTSSLSRLKDYVHAGVAYENSAAVASTTHSMIHPMNPSIDFSSSGYDHHDHPEEDGSLTAYLPPSHPESLIRIQPHCISKPLKTFNSRLSSATISAGSITVDASSKSTQPISTLEQLEPASYFNNLTSTVDFNIVENLLQFLNVGINLSTHPMVVGYQENGFSLKQSRAKGVKPSQNAQEYETTTYTAQFHNLNLLKSIHKVSPVPIQQLAMAYERGELALFNKRLGHDFYHHMIDLWRDCLMSPRVFTDPNAMKTIYQLATVGVVQPSMTDSPSALTFERTSTQPAVETDETAVISHTNDAYHALLSTIDETFHRGTTTLSPSTALRTSVLQQQASASKTVIIPASSLGMGGTAHNASVSSPSQAVSDRANQSSPIKSYAIPESLYSLPHVRYLTGRYKSNESNSSPQEPLAIHTIDENKPDLHNYHLKLNELAKYGTSTDHTYVHPSFIRNLVGSLLQDIPSQSNPEPVQDSAQKQCTPQAHYPQLRAIEFLSFHLCDIGTQIHYNYPATSSSNTTPQNTTTQPPNDTVQPHTTSPDDSGVIASTAPHKPLLGNYPVLRPPLLVELFTHSCHIARLCFPTVFTKLASYYPIISRCVLPSSSPRLPRTIMQVFNNPVVYELLFPTSTSFLPTSQDETSSPRSFTSASTSMVSSNRTTHADHINDENLWFNWYRTMISIAYHPSPGSLVENHTTNSIVENTLTVLYCNESATSLAESADLHLTYTPESNDPGEKSVQLADMAVIRSIRQTYFKYILIAIIFRILSYTQWDVAKPLSTTITHGQSSLDSDLRGSESSETCTAETMTSDEETSQPPCQSDCNDTHTTEATNEEFDFASYFSPYNQSHVVTVDPYHYTPKMQTMMKQFGCIASFNEDIYQHITPPENCPPKHYRHLFSSYIADQDSSDMADTGNTSPRNQDEPQHEDDNEMVDESSEHHSDDLDDENNDTHDDSSSTSSSSSDDGDEFAINPPESDPLRIHMPDEYIDYHRSIFSDTYSNTWDFNAYSFSNQLENEFLKQQLRIRVHHHRHQFLQYHLDIVEHKVNDLKLLLLGDLFRWYSKQSINDSLSNIYQVLPPEYVEYYTPFVQKLHEEAASRLQSRSHSQTGGTPPHATTVEDGVPHTIVEPLQVNPGHLPTISIPSSLSQNFLTKTQTEIGDTGDDIVFPSPSYNSPMVDFATSPPFPFAPGAPAVPDMAQGQFSKPVRVRHPVAASGRRRRKYSRAGPPHSAATPLISTTAMHSALKTFTSLTQLIARFDPTNPLAKSSFNSNAITADSLLPQSPLYGINTPSSPQSGLQQLVLTVPSLKWLTYHPAPTDYSCLVPVKCVHKQSIEYHLTIQSLPDSIKAPLCISIENEPVVKAHAIATLHVPIYPLTLWTSLDFTHASILIHRHFETINKLEKIKHPLFKSTLAYQGVCYHREARKRYLAIIPPGPITLCKKIRYKIDPVSLSLSIREQRAMLRSRSSQDSTADEDTASGITRKHIIFKRSPIHDFGVYALENILEGQYVMEYNGITYRSNLADIRENRYMREGMESTYLFCVDDEYIIDATNSGNIGRFVNHSCNPNCSTRVERIGGFKKIVIYAMRDIPAGTEITYDYKFPYEEIKIPCYCGAPNCRGSLN